MSAPLIDSETLRVVADYVEALNAVTEKHSGDVAYVQNIPVVNVDGDRLGTIVDEIGGVYHFIPGEPS